MHIRRGRQAAGTAGASLMRCISASFRYPAGSSGKVRMRARKPCLQKADSGSAPGMDVPRRMSGEGTEDAVPDPCCPGRRAVAGRFFLPYAEQ